MICKTKIGFVDSVIARIDTDKCEKSALSYKKKALLVFLLNLPRFWDDNLDVTIF
jgi:hypothetical protein